MSSLSKCEVFQIEKIQHHPDADSLDCVEVFGWNSIVRRGDFKKGDVCIFVPVDIICPNLPQFEFLGSNKRIKARRLRGIFSYGLIIKAPEGASVGDDLTESMGFQKWEPELENSGNKGYHGQNIKPPRDFPKYDIDSMLRYHRMFTPGEEIVASEKCEGENCRCYADETGQIYVGSRNYWKKEDEKCVFWQALYNSPYLIDFLKANPYTVIYGESVGGVKNYRYGLENGKRTILVFDIMQNGRWLDVDNARELGKMLTWVPIVYRGPFDLEHLKSITDGPSLVPGATNIREGLCVRPIVERYDFRLGRAHLKLISEAYLLGKK